MKVANIDAKQLRSFKSVRGLTLAATAWVLLTLGPARALAQIISGHISTIGNTVHLEFHGRQEWIYNSPKRHGNVVTVTLPAFSKATVAQLDSWHSQLVPKISVNTNGPDGKYVISFYVSKPNVEVFDYLTDDPSSLIFDFFKTTPKKKVVSSSLHSRARFKGKRLARWRGKHRINRAPASTEFIHVNPYLKIPNRQVFVAGGGSENQAAAAAANIRFEQGAFDGADPKYNRFRIKNYQIKQNSIIAAKQNIYIHFPMLALRLNRFNELMKTPPIYEIKPDDNLSIAEQNKDARFLLFLFKEKHWGAFFKTYAYFEKKYPNSKYDQIVKNMAAEADVRLYQSSGNPVYRRAFQSLYTYLVAKYPKSVLAQRNLLLLAYSHLDENDAIGALRLLMLEQKKYPNSRESDYVKMGIAECDLLMAEPKKALAMYNEVVNHPKIKTSAVQALYRIGDVYFHERQYAKAILAYKKAQKMYPAFNIVYPNAQYNESEAEFWLHHYKRSLNGFITFIRIYPNQAYGGYALTRIGELLEILGASKKRVTGAYLEAYFRYPNCPGSEVARVRMLSEDLKNMAPRERKLAFKEIREIAKRSKLPHIEEFRALVEAAGLTSAGLYRNSLHLLLNYYQSHPDTARLNVFRGRILRDISDVLQQDIQQHKFMNALKFYGKYAGTWLKHSGRIDTAFFQAEAFEQAGVPAEAELKYKQILAKRLALVGTKEEKEREVYEHLPSVAEIDLRLAAVTADQRHYHQAIHYLKQIHSRLSPAEEIERVQIGATVAEKTGDTKEAIENLEKLESVYANDKNQSRRMVGPSLQLARLYIEERNFAGADASLKRIEALRTTDRKAVTNDEWAQDLTLRGNLLLAEGRKLGAVEAYQKLLARYGSSRPLASIRYKAGRILYEEGDLQGAEKMWTGFKGETGGFYKRLAEEKIQEAKWNNKYGRYIDSIPNTEAVK